MAAAPAGKVYPFVWLDAIHYKSPGGWSLPEQAVYDLLANLEAKVLGLYLSESEGANFTRTGDLHKTK